MRYHFTPVRVGIKKKSNKPENSKCWENVEKLEPLCNAHLPIVP